MTPHMNNSKFIRNKKNLSNKFKENFDQLLYKKDFKNPRTPSTFPEEESNLSIFIILIAILALSCAALITYSTKAKISDLPASYYTGPKEKSSPLGLESH